MERKYDKALLDRLAQEPLKTTFKGTEVLIKAIPDENEPGAMDPRLYASMKGMLTMMRFMPKGLMKFDMSPKGIVKLRKMFNEVKGIPITVKPIIIENKTVKAKDGHDIPIRIYTTTTMNSDLPILYYIHGGGFFGGHPGVVEESVKLIVEKYDLPIVSVDYRLAPENPYPIGHNDVLSVYRWILENAVSIHGDNTKIFVSGDSAGGNLAQYCSSKAVDEKLIPVKGQLLLYPTLNMAGVEDDFYHWSIDQFEMSKKHKAGITMMLGMFGGMGNGFNTLLGVFDLRNDDLNPYSRDPHHNPTTFVAVGEHDYLKVETLAYAAKLHSVGIKTKALVYKGMGHAFFDQCGIYPQCEDLANEMGKFMLENQ